MAANTAMSINSTHMEGVAGQNDHMVNTPATTYLVSQGGQYYSLYNNNNNSGYQGMQADNRACCNGAFGRAEQTAKYDEMDLYSIKPHVKVDFEETFQEPSGSETVNVVWNYNKLIFTWTSRGFYIFLSALLGPILGIAWGLVFATMNFALVWLVNPALKVILQACRIVEVLTRGMVRSSLDPIFQSIGQMFTFLRGNFTLTVPGLSGLTSKKESGADTMKLPITTTSSNI